MPSAAVNGVSIHYQVQGEGPALVLCHGLGGNMLSWWQQVPELSQRFKCVTFDHRGFGSSTNTEGAGAEAFADDLAALLDHLQVQEASIVGHSMGGRTALGFAKRYPDRVRALVFAGSVANIRTPELDQVRRDVRAVRPKNRLRIALAAAFQEQRPEMGYLYRQIAFSNPPRTTEFLHKDTRPGTILGEIKVLRMPTLFIVGEEDQICPPHMVETAYRYFPNARLARVPGAGHSVYFEQPQFFNRLVSDFCLPKTQATA